MILDGALVLRLDLPRHGPWPGDPCRLLVRVCRTVNLLQPLVERCRDECGVRLSLLAKPKSEDGAAQPQQLIAAIKADPAGAGGVSEGAPVRVGHLPKDKHDGKVAELFNQVRRERLRLRHAQGGTPCPGTPCPGRDSMPWD